MQDKDLRVTLQSLACAKIKVCVRARARPLGNGKLLGRRFVRAEAAALGRRGLARTPRCFHVRTNSRKLKKCKESNNTL